MLYKEEKPAILMFQDGTYYEGIGFGATGKVSGEITISAIPGSGYTEILTDPTLKDKIVLFTYPSIGNFGVPEKKEDQYGILTKFESETIKLRGMIVNEYCKLPSHYESVRTLEDWLIEENIPAIQWIDTRMLTQEFVKGGCRYGLIQVLNKGETPDIDQLKREAATIEVSLNKNLVASVSVKEIKTFTPESPKGKVIILDLGVKNNIIRVLLSKNYEVVVVPYNYSYDKIKDLNPTGVLLSNGPGNPIVYSESIDLAKRLIENGIPTLGIGLGHAIIGLASGGSILKMNGEHRGGRTTVLNENNHCYITFQNHGYCLKDFNQEEFKELYHDKDDNTNDGLEHKSKPIFSVGFNPEGAPGALDMKELIFNKFLKLMEV